MAREEIYTGLDLGSSTVRIVVGQHSENGQFQILGVAEHPSEGISRGVITSIEDTVSSISGALEKAERMTGLPIEHAFVGINGNHITSQNSHGVVAVSKADGEIKEDDVVRVIEAAQSVAIPPNYETLHVIPRSFSVDNQSGIKDPVGMTGIRLEVDAQIIQGLSSQVKNTTKCIYRTGLDIDDLVLGVLAASESVLTHRQKELGVALINIGAATTSVAVFEEGDIIHMTVLPVGSGHITNDIAIGLRTSIEVAEQVKIEAASCVPEEVNKRDEINLNEISDSENTVVSRKHIAEIAEARVEEIFTMVDKELQKIERSGLLPAGVILTGGGAKLPGAITVAKQIFKLPAALGTPRDIVSSIDKITDPAFATAIGLAIWGAQANSKSHAFSGSSFSSVADVTGKLRKWFRSLVP
ncbi:MAG: cell division protein FtsA [Patescibacteria group bacterium]|jgi:cell division protein FtsA